MLGLFPATLLLLLSFAVISFLLRVLVVCCRLIKFFIKFCAQQWLLPDTTPLLNVCTNTDGDVEGYMSSNERWLASHLFISCSLAK